MIQLTDFFCSILFFFKGTIRLADQTGDHQIVLTFILWKPRFLQVK